MMMTDVIVSDLGRCRQWASELLADVSSDARVFIKPNLCNEMPASSGVTTDLGLVEILIKLLLGQGVRNITVGESAIYKTQEVLDRHAFFSLEKYGVKAVNLDRDRWVKVDNRSFDCFGTFHLPQSVLDADVLISVPKMKTHCETGVSLSVKNLVGLVPRGDRKLAHLGNINQAIVSIFGYLKERMVIKSVIDGLVALEGRRGPTMGNPVNLGAIIMSNDPVAADVVAVEIMGGTYKSIEHLCIAGERGLGNADGINVLGLKVASLKRRFVMPVTRGHQGGSLFYRCIDRVFKKKPFLADRNKCGLCLECVEICPKTAIRIVNDSPVFDYRECISCLCCCESCKSGALNYRVPWEQLYRAARKCRNIIRCYI